MGAPSNENRPEMFTVKFDRTLRTLAGPVGTSHGGSSAGTGGHSKVHLVKTHEPRRESGKLKRGLVRRSLFDPLRGGILTKIEADQYRLRERWCGRRRSLSGLHGRFRGAQTECIHDQDLAARRRVVGRYECRTITVSDNRPADCREGQQHVAGLKVIAVGDDVDSVEVRRQLEGVAVNTIFGNDEDRKVCRLIKLRRVRPKLVRDLDHDFSQLRSTRRKLNVEAGVEMWDHLKDRNGGGRGRYKRLLDSS